MMYPGTLERRSRGLIHGRQVPVSTRVNGGSQPQRSVPRGGSGSRDGLSPRLGWLLMDPPLRLARHRKTLP